MLFSRSHFFRIDGYCARTKRDVRSVCSRADFKTKNDDFFPVASLPQNLKMKTTLLAIVVALSSASVASASGAVELTKLNFDEKTSGKNAFVKFLAPWVSSV
jgi:hypothetical protein